MDIQYGAYPYYGILFGCLKKGSTYWYILQCERALSCMLSKKGESHRRLHVVWFYVYKVSREVKSIGAESRLEIALG